jgi:uncharacterized membrane protein YdbT with pleckstrin-like domain
MTTALIPKLKYKHIKFPIQVNLVLIFLFAILLFTRLFWVGIIVEVFLLLSLIRVIIVDMTEYITLEDHCACVHTGLFFVRNNRVPYTKMNSIDITNFLGFHNLEIDAGNDVSEIKFGWVEDAHQLKEILDEKLQINNYYQNSKNQALVAENRQYHNPPTNPQQYHSSNHQNVTQNIQELNQLAYLRSKGVITAQEFEDQKRKILAD